MRGTTIIKNESHARYAGGPERVFDRSEVVAFGRHARYGDFVTRYQVRLADGTELMVSGADQDTDDRRWLRRWAKCVPSPIANRDNPQVDTWIDLDLGR